MSGIYLSRHASEPLKEYLRRLGHRVTELEEDRRFGAGLECHPDLRLCGVGVSGDVIRPQGLPSPVYPENAAMCAVVLDGFLIHRLDITDAAVLKYCRERGFREINVRQGYTKCSCVVVDGRSVITSDPGIWAALKGVPEIDTLMTAPGHILLAGFEYGFIGGASGRVGGEVVFDGDLSAHPDFCRICEFIERRGLGVRYFPDHPLTDTGSIIEETE